MDVQYRASWKSVLGVLKSPGMFSNEDSGNPVMGTSFHLSAN